MTFCILLQESSMNRPLILNSLMLWQSQSNLFVKKQLLADIKNNDVVFPVVCAKQACFPIWEEYDGASL